MSDCTAVRVRSPTGGVDESSIDRGQITRQSGAKLQLMQPFVEHSGKIAVLDQDNLDTDRIIPARFLSRVSRSGYGELLFKDVRGPDFPLDQPDAEGATILVVGSNFGSGSSREHAVWAIQQAGYQAVIAHKTEQESGFSDIFRQNAANCGLLLIEFPTAIYEELKQAGSGAEASINLPEQTVTLGPQVFSFDITPASKNALLKGLDLIGTTLELENEICNYEREHPGFIPK